MFHYLEVNIYIYKIIKYGFNLIIFGTESPKKETKPRFDFAHLAESATTRDYEKERDLDEKPKDPQIISHALEYILTENLRYLIVVYLKTKHFL